MPSDSAREKNIPAQKARGSREEQLMKHATGPDSPVSARRQDFSTESDFS